jgi:hypothetical protein
MNVISEKSLYKTVTDAALFLFDGGIFSSLEKIQLVNWILGHQNREKKFIFYPTAADQDAGVRLFSGEKIKAKFLADNTVELETLRLLALLRPEMPEVQQLFWDANQRLFPICFANGCTVGKCRHASIAVMRYLTASDFSGSADRLERTLGILKQHRDGDSKWKAFPFYFTLLWLTELPDDLSRDELQYARANCERILAKGLQGDDPSDALRKKILQKVVA